MQHSISGEMTTLEEGRTLIICRGALDFSVAIARPRDIRAVDAQERDVPDVSSLDI